MSDKVHELSTIIELDTPATSRINLSDHRPEQNNEMIEISLNTEMALKIQQFPPSQTLADDVLAATTIVNSTTVDNLKIQKFLHHKEWASGNVSGLCDTASIEAAAVDDVVVPNITVPQFKPFATHEEYAAGVSGLCDSVSVAAAADSTFPDIEAELKLRKIISRSFESLKFVSSSEDEMSNHADGSPPRPPPQKATEQTTSKHTNRQLLMHSSSSDNLEQEMAKIGLNWASAMIKKTNDLKKLTSSSSSTSLGKSDQQQKSAATNSFVDANIEIPVANETTMNTNASSAGRPLNLNEFLNRELLKKSSATSSSSTTNDDSTLASQFLRSLLGSSEGGTLSSSTTTTRHKGFVAHVSEKHRTSTPVRHVSSTMTQSHHATTRQRLTRSPTEHNFFSADSVMSSVRAATSYTTSSSNSQSTNNSKNGNNQQFDALSVPDLKLSIPPTQTEKSSSNSS